MDQWEEQEKTTVVLNYLGRKGGGAVYAYEMAKGLVENGCQVYAIVSKDIENISLWGQLALAQLICVETYRSAATFVTGIVRFLLWDQWKLKRIFRGVSIDACYVPMIQPWSGLVNRHFKDAPLFVTLHDPIAHSGTPWITRTIYRRVAKAADVIILLSSRFLEYTASAYHKGISDIHVIPHGVFDYYEKLPTSLVVKRTAGTNFLFFGRITPYKGLHLLAEAYARLKREGYDVSLSIVGSGDLSEYISEFSAEEDVVVDNRFLPDEDVFPYFRGERIVTVLPYLDATQSGVVPIAMLAQSLLIATDTGGLREQTCDGRYAILCEPNACSLYEAMKEAALHHDSYRQMLTEAEGYIRSLSWDKLSGQLVDLFKKYTAEDAS
ncbi:MAG: glycosyltransferase family 4 protein [Oscillospiraceae bacterium]|jgi:glycosyltransferase involved in cell wall biosynthesis